MARIASCRVELGGHQLTVTDCGTCGEVFAITSEYEEARRRDIRNFYCPNGHNNVYPLGETEAQREIRQWKARAALAEGEVVKQRSMRERAEAWAKGANISAGKAKAAKHRLEHRIACGVCPKCQRTFKQLAAHMKAKHGQGKG